MSTSDEIVVYEATCTTVAPVTLVALPGLGGNAWSFPEPMFDAVRNLGVTVVCMAYGSRVTTVKDMASASWENLADIGVALHDGSVILLGYSMGGFVAQQMVQQHSPWVAGIVFLATACAHRSSILISPAVLQDALKARVRRTHRYAPPKAIVSRGTFFREMLAVFGFVLSSKSCRKLQHITAPVLILHGEQDDVLPIDNATRLRDSLTRTTASYVAVPDATHALPFEETQLVSTVIAQWAVRTGAVTPAALCSRPQ